MLNTNKTVFIGDIESGPGRVVSSITSGSRPRIMAPIMSEHEGGGDTSDSDQPAKKNLNKSRSKRK